MPTEFAHQRAAIAHLVAAHPDSDEESAVWASSVLCEGTEESYSHILSAIRDACASVKSVEALSKFVLSLLEQAHPGRREFEAVYDALDDILRRRKSDLLSLSTGGEEKWLQEILAT